MFLDVFAPLKVSCSLALATALATCAGHYNLKTEETRQRQTNKTARRQVDDFSQVKPEEEGQYRSRL